MVQASPSVTQIESVIHHSKEVHQTSMEENKKLPLLRRNSSLPDLSVIDFYLLESNCEGNRLQATVSTFGASLISVKHEVNGVFEELTLNFPDPKDIDKLVDKELNPKYGATCGRTAGRIAKGKFSVPDLDQFTESFGSNIEFQLEKNNGENNLHGGSRGYDQRIWNAEIKKDYTQNLVTKDNGIENKWAIGVLFSRISEDGEEGYPGRIKVEAGYYITADNELIFTWRAYFVEKHSSNMPTPINLCNHTYWNLSGDFKQPTIANHKLKLNCAKYIPLDKDLIPTKELRSVESTILDFRELSTIGDDERLSGMINAGGRPGIEHPFVVDGSEDFEVKIRDVAELQSDTRRMTIRST